MNLNFELCCLHHKVYFLIFIRILYRVIEQTKKPLYLPIKIKSRDGVIIIVMSQLYSYFARKDKYSHTDSPSAFEGYHILQFYN